MNLCPHCGAELREHARFCTACMTPLNDKRVVSTPKMNHQRWLSVTAAVLVFFLVGAVLWRMLPQETPLVEQTSTSVAPKTTVITNQEESTKASGNATASGSTKTKGSTKASGSATVSGNITTPSSVTTRSSATTRSSVTTSRSATSGSNTTTRSTTNNNPDAVIYLYRDARAGDDFSVFANLENAVVITGVSAPTENGVYTIPETLGGKRVIAIMGNAFCANNIKDTVKSVVVPAAVKTIWNNAFATCYYLTDIYFLGDDIYTESNAFADPAKRVGTLTIHCSATCTDRALRYYKNSASSYHARYKELSVTDGSRSLSPANAASLYAAQRLKTENEAMYGGGGQ